MIANDGVLLALPIATFEIWHWLAAESRLGFHNQHACTLPVDLIVFRASEAVLEMLPIAVGTIGEHIRGVWGVN